MQDIGYDVVIIGAGPGGVSAAFFLKHLDKENALNVCLIEKLAEDEYVGYHNRCGCGASDFLFEELFSKEKEYIIEEIKTSRNIFPEGLVIENPAHGYILDRPLFFRNICEKYKAQGGTVFNNRLLDFNIGDESIKLKLADQTFLRTKYLIGADGPNSRIRKKLGLQGNLGTLAQFLIDEEPEHRTISFEYDEKYSGGYKWVFPHGAITKIGMPVQKGTSPSIENDNVIERQARRIGFGGLQSYAKGNVLLVGDAGCQANAITKGGIRQAMTAGKLAAEALISGEPAAYDKAWQENPLQHPLFLEAFKKLRNLKNAELHTIALNLQEMSASGQFDIPSDEYKDIYMAFGLTNNYGW